MEPNGYGGSFQRGENVAAGTGATCVNTVRRFLKFVRPETQTSATDTMVFSCIFHAGLATIWIHWYAPPNKNEVEKFKSAMVARYDLLYKQEDLIQFLAALRNIIDWNIHQRLPLLRNALTELAPRVEQWDEQWNVLVRNRDLDRAVEWKYEGSDGNEVSADEERAENKDSGESDESEGNEEDWLSAPIRFSTSLWS